MALVVPPATTLKQRIRWLAYADEQDWIASSCEKQGFPNAGAHNRASAEKYRAAAAAFRPNIEGDD